jgi:hypothetical protein
MNIHEGFTAFRAGSEDGLSVRSKIVHIRVPNPIQ